MITLQRSALVPYSAKAMYDLVNDIEHYPEFLPWCIAAVVHEQNSEKTVATIRLASGKIQKSFTTANLLTEGKCIDMHLVSGPFKHFSGVWHFYDLPQGGCKVTLDMEFEFAGGIANMLFNPLFKKAGNTLVEAFCQRAKEVYGTTA